MACVGLAGGFGEEAEVEPDARIFGIALGGFLEDLLGVVEALHVEEGDADVDAADVGFLVEDAGALKFAEGFFEVLAVHEGDAVIIFADDFGAGGLLLFGGGVFVMRRRTWERGACWGACWDCWPRLVRERARMARGMAKSSERCVNGVLVAGFTGFILVENGWGGKCERRPKLSPRVGDSDGVSYI